MTTLEEKTMLAFFKDILSIDGVTYDSEKFLHQLKPNEYTLEFEYGGFNHTLTYANSKYLRKLYVFMQPKVAKTDSISKKLVKKIELNLQNSLSKKPELNKLGSLYHSWNIALKDIKSAYKTK